MALNRFLSLQLFINLDCIFIRSLRVGVWFSSDCGCPPVGDLFSTSHSPIYANLGNWNSCILID